MRSKTILLTGGTGFLGGHLLRRLVAAGHRVIVLGRDETRVEILGDVWEQIIFVNKDRQPLGQIFEGHLPEAVLHCATNYGRSQTSLTDILDANLMLPLHLLQQCKLHGVAVFLNTDTCLDKRVNAYSLSKSQFLEWLGIFAQEMVCVNAVLSHFFGPGDDPSKFVSQMVRALVREQSPIALTPGEQTRDFIYIDDVVSALLAMLHWSDSACSGLHQFDVGTGQELSIRMFLQMAREVAEKPSVHLDFGALPYRPREAMSVHVDNTRLKEMGWAPRVSLREGLRRTVAHERTKL